MKVKVSEILALCKTAQELTGEDDPEITYDEIMRVLFPTQWKLDNYYLHRKTYSDDDSDCYCE